MSNPTASFIPLGAIIQSLDVTGTNIVLGFSSQKAYESHNTCFFGETIGRVANRVKDAKIDSLNGGKSYTLAANNGVNNLHGGVKGWGKKVWDGPKPVGIKEIPAFEGKSDKIDGGESVQFTLVSEDGDEGFPGKVEARVIYTVSKEKSEDGKEKVLLAIEYEAELLDGEVEETVINMTNHSYFNLTGGPSIEGTIVTLATNQYLPVDQGGIPTGGPAPFPDPVVKAGGNAPFTLGAVEPDIDDCFIVNEDPSSVPIDTRSLPLKKNLSAFHPESKIHLEVYSTEPAFQFYTGKYIDIPAVDGVPARKARAGFCLEPSRWVNACNVPEWKGQMLLKKGEKYGSKVLYRAWKE
ncbi:galactose mutarotase-like domain-containing protein [Pseudoneurospora amorphoporcata]|uniref:Galactose mutarotase-like domain-containing protein n=1 Tax=Pseudoneurospora amorphoporcata TaxID=241081 RepID=A0AAN6NMM0_9PEZI|nr:galactose mutarotase-like domain-containing protein [Pseudoneurospora amorphoporcata]